MWRKDFFSLFYNVQLLDLENYGWSDGHSTINKVQKIAILLSHGLKLFSLKLSDFSFVTNGIASFLSIKSVLLL